MTEQRATNTPCTCDECGQRTTQDICHPLMWKGAIGGWVHKERCWDRYLVRVRESGIAKRLRQGRR